MYNSATTAGVSSDPVSAWTAVPYFLEGTGADGIPKIGNTQTGGPSFSNAALVAANNQLQIPAYPLSNNSVTVLGQPFGWFITLMITVLLLLWLNQTNLISKSPGHIKGSLANLLIIGLTSIIFISGSKALLSRYPVPGLTTLVSGV